MLSLGIVGLPNVGKSSLFNAITSAGAAAANYPFCTIDPNIGVVDVPDARLDTLFLALPVSWKGTLIQYTGRLHRLHPGKTEVRIFDYVDRDVPMLGRMFEKRLRGYRAIGYARGEAPLGYGEPADDTVVEYDQDVLRSLKDMDGSL